MFINLFVYDIMNSVEVFMDIYQLEILKFIANETYLNQRAISQATNISLGKVNNALKQLVEIGYLDAEFQLTTLGKTWLKRQRPKNAIILAAGFGLRMVPINNETPKAFLEIDGEPLIERVIKQLQAKAITDITIVVGFMKDKFEYLIDLFGVKMSYNPRYADLNNLYSLSLVADQLNNTYIIPSDLWMEHNPFSAYEPYSWYAVSEALSEESTVYFNRQKELLPTEGKNLGNAMIGIAYITSETALTLRLRLKELVLDKHYADEFWESALFNTQPLIPIYAKLYPAKEVIEINTYEQLRELDKNSNNLENETLRLISREMNVPLQDILAITILKKGMTNRSFKFQVGEATYIMRIPGEGTDQLINRPEEYDVYQVIKPYQLSDEVVYFDPVSGFKISRFLTDAEVADPYNETDVKACMGKLRQFHELNLTVKHSFDIFGKIDFYESLWHNQPSIFKDYSLTKQRVFNLKPVIAQFPRQWSLTHIDAVPDNFLFVKDRIYLIDWEYAAMQDPHVDIAMFAIYSLYEKPQVDALLEAYFPEGYSADIRLKVYCYIAACGLLWSNWCEYKRFLGVEFGEYSLRQYRYAKEYYQLVKKEYPGLE